jgi:hypothetical protein
MIERTMPPSSSALRGNVLFPTHPTGHCAKGKYPDKIAQQKISYPYTFLTTGNIPTTKNEHKKGQFEPARFKLSFLCSFTPFMEFTP